MITDESDFTLSMSEGEDYVPETKKKTNAKTKSTTTVTSKGVTKKTKTSTNSASSAVKKPASKSKTKKVLESAINSAESSAPSSPRREDGSTVTKKGMTPKKAIEDIYQKKTQLEHILIRPDTYIGSIEPITTPLWVYENEKMVHRPVTYVPGLYKIFDEIIVNAADNKVRDPTMDLIKVTIDRENNRISVYNSGRGIPIEVHKKEGVYVPELIFGHLLTSSNYNDDERKVTGGRNGYGAKLCNIFSTEFIVETADSRSGRKFKQVFGNNMSRKSDPVISPNPKNEDFTRITFKPDLAKFKMTSFDDDLMALLTKRVYDLAGVVRGIKVFLNDTRLKIKDFKEYVDLYLTSSIDPDSGVKPGIVYERVNDRWEIAFSVSDGQFNQVSFVNSICTSKGGTHVNYVSDQIVTSLIEAVKKKDKKGVPLKPFQAKSYLWVFINCQIENPAFDSQTKENMTLRSSAFGSKCPVSEDFMKKVLKSGVIDKVLSFAKFKQDQMLKKTDGSGKRLRISGITKLDDANNAGTKNASKCTLILTEGDSAKSLAVSGLSVVGRDNFGVFPLRGKLLNVREASHSQITANAEISAIKQILGLQHGKEYTDANSLRYGHLMIMTDQDHDGSHIKGLIINFLDHFWPSLLKIPGFLLEFITPIVKATKGKGARRDEISFFTIPEYEEWKRQNDDGHGWTIKYYKGLGTSTTEDAKKYFSDMNKHLKPFEPCPTESRDLIDMAFNKKKADDRKEWLRRFQPGTFMDHTMSQIPISDFINKELILYSMADNVRSIPSSVDGFKPGHRKILFACFKRNLKAEIKVAQLAGYVSEHAAYHHGEQSLCQTIIGMAQNFVGSNNLPLLEPRGQFGTRLQGGKDAASPRYIFTTLSPLARAVFHPADDALLKYLNDDGQSIEPEWYLPVLPMILVNGGEGIGTGWSSSVPNYNPRDIVANLYRLMRGESLELMDPWYRGFSGLIERETADRYKVTGTIRKVDSNTVEITELPIRSWTQTYKEQLEAWLTGTDKQPAWIKDYKEYHTDARVHFLVTLSDDQMALAEKEGLEKRFKITSTISVSNLVCFDLEGRIRKYESVNDILEDFYHLRKNYYQKRKDHLLEQLTFELDKLDNKVRFVSSIISGKLVIQNKKKADILKELASRNFTPIFKKRHEKSGQENQEGQGEEDAHDANGKDHGYDYLLSMPLWNLTAEKVEALNREKVTKEAEVKHLLSQSILDLWRTDLDAFLAQWEAFENALEELESAKPNNNTTAGGLKLKGKKTVKKVAAKKTMKIKLNSDGEEESDITMDEADDDDDDFAPVKKLQRPISKKMTVGTSSMNDIFDTKEPKTKTIASKPVKVKQEKKTGSSVTVKSEPSSPKSNMTSNTNVEQPKKKIVLGAKKAAAVPSRNIKDMFTSSSSSLSSSKQLQQTSLMATGHAIAIAPAAEPDPIEIISSDDDHDDVVVVKPSSKSKQKLAKMEEDEFGFDDDDIRPSQRKMVKLAGASTVKPTVTSKKATTSKSTVQKLILKDDEEMDTDMAPVKRVGRRAATTAKSYRVVDDDDSDEESEASEDFDDENDDDESEFDEDDD